MTGAVPPSPVHVRRSRDLGRRLSALGAAFADSRGARFARGKGLVDAGKTPPTLADLINLPDWILCDEAMAGDIASVTALLHYRRAIDHELSGTRLRAICDHVGEDNYDLACEAPTPPAELMAGDNAFLPAPEQLKVIGQSMLDRALPVAMQSRAPAACDDAPMKTLSNIATALVIARQNASVESPA
jgi:hypothetical protein